MDLNDVRNVTIHNSKPENYAFDLRFIIFLHVTSTRKVELGHEWHGAVSVHLSDRKNMLLTSVVISIVYYYLFIYLFFTYDNLMTLYNLTTPKHIGLT